MIYNIFGTFKASYPLTSIMGSVALISSFYATGQVMDLTPYIINNNGKTLLFDSDSNSFYLDGNRIIPGGIPNRLLDKANVDTISGFVRFGGFKLQHLDPANSVLTVFAKLKGGSGFCGNSKSYEERFRDQKFYQTDLSLVSQVPGNSKMGIQANLNPNEVHKVLTKSSGFPKTLLLNDTVKHLPTSNPYCLD